MQNFDPSGVGEIWGVLVRGYQSRPRSARTWTSTARLLFGTASRCDPQFPKLDPLLAQHGTSSRMRSAFLKKPLGEPIRFAQGRLIGHPWPSGMADFFDQRLRVHFRQAKNKCKCKANLIYNRY